MAVKESTPSLLDQGLGFVNDFLSTATGAVKDYQQWELSMEEQETKQAVANQVHMTGTTNPTLVHGAPAPYPYATAQGMQGVTAGVPTGVWIAGGLLVGGIVIVLALK